ncbi:MAG TPA: dTDP-4-dehydrorhamnose 3,5-epimerase [Thermomicrobiales bacterium]|nr:dTDP-4-dehydrorhamnose 3,5-epimerase [Thermomicrobiales bacterium]
MTVNVIQTELPGVVIIEPRKFGDDRGYFMETWNRDTYREAGLDLTFVQDNLSSSSRGVLRGLHYQLPSGQGKLVSCVQGEVFDVAVDIRRGSPTFGRWVGVSLSAENARRLYIPPEFAHGFQVVSETALFTYKCTDVYNKSAEGSVRWDDPAIGIDWPVADPSLSDKDRVAPLLADVPQDRLPLYGETDSLAG